MERGGGKSAYQRVDALGLELDTPGDTDGVSAQSSRWRRNPEQQAGCCSALFMSWLFPLLRQGRRAKLGPEDLYPLMPSEQAQPIAERFQQEWDSRTGSWSGQPGKRMVACLWSMEGRTYAVMFVVKMCGDLMRFVTPLIMQQVITWVEDHDATPPLFAAAIPAQYRGYMYVALMTLATVCQSLCYSTSFFKGFRLGTHVRTAVTVAVYRKSLLQVVSARSEVSTGSEWPALSSLFFTISHIEPTLLP